MYGAVTQIELNSFLDVNSIDNEQRKRNIKASWPEAVETFEQLRRSEAGAPDTVECRPIPEDSKERVDALRADTAFLSNFSNYPFSFEEIEIDKLVACQRTVHIDYVRHLQSEYERRGKDLFDFCLLQGQDVTQVNIGRTAPNAFTASSENPGLRFLGAYEQQYQREFLHGHAPGGQPVRTIILVLGYGSSTVNVYRVGHRLILNNGFHRLYALRGLGITHVPVVVQRITHPDLELPPLVIELPRDYVAQNARPALMKDFFNDRLTCEITQRNFIKAVQVGWGVSESLVPR